MATFKEVRYKGFEFDVPWGANYMAVNAFGDIWVYRDKPEQETDEGIWASPTDDIDVEDFILHVGYCWDESLKVIPENKTVNEYDRDFIVPDWAKWSAVDADGNLWVFEEMPHPTERIWVTENPYAKSTLVYCICEDWKNSLEKI